MASDGRILWSVFLITMFVTTTASRYKCEYEPNHCQYCGQNGIYNGTSVITAVCKEHTKLHIIPTGLPSNLSKLDAQSNRIQNLTKNSLKKFPLLKILHLRGNHMKRIENGTFLNQGLLLELDLKDNEIASINEKTFEGLRSLRMLQLSHNKITTLNRETFASLASVQNLSLAENQIKIIPTGTFDHLDNLKKLELNDNKIKVLEKGALGNLMSLTKLSLNHNELQNIHGDIFSCAPMVNTLHLNKNKLISVPKKALRRLQFLKMLDLSMNPITFIESDAFYGLKKLQTLKLSKCGISTIQKGSLEHIGEAKTFLLYLDGNPLHCGCKLSWLRDWSSSLHQLSINSTVCNSPSSLRGKAFSRADVSEFKCTCDECAKDCAGAKCSCDKEWAGRSCDLGCQSANTSLEGCSYLNGTCYCANTTLAPQEESFEKCSFNVTTRLCSDNASIKKFGSHLDCVCNKGFTGDGVQCTDVDECADIGKHNCHKNADCINTVGSRHCKCSYGYKDAVPSHPGLLCSDINECKETKGACHIHAQCYNLEGKD